MADAPAVDTRQEWLEWRRGGITATDVAKAFTGKYGGMWAVLAEKRGEPVDVPDDEQLDRMKRGKDLEPVVSAMVELGTGLVLRGDETWCEHARHPRHRCTVDRFALKDEADPLDHAVCPVEIKTYADEAHPAWDYYDAQTQWQLHVTGWDLLLLAVSAYDQVEDLVHGPRLRIVRPDPLVQAELIATADRIDAHLASGEWPDPDGSMAAGAVIERQAAPDAALDAVDLTALVEDLDEYATITELTAKGGPRDVLRQRIQLGLGDATKGLAPGFKVGWSRPSRKVDELAVLADHPHLAKSVLDMDAAETDLGKAGLDKYRQPIGPRRLTVTRDEEEVA